MSNQFSYELDERQIKLLMKDAELEYNEALWQKFDALAAADCKSSHSINLTSYVPKFNLSISRSVVVPVLFIILIGGLSAMLFSFVDFKKKETIDKETPLVANPENFKKTSVIPVKVVKPVKAKIVSKPAAVTPTPTIVEPTKTATIEPEIKNLKPEKVLELTNVKVAEPTSSETKKEVAVQPIKKKKKKKVVVEELPTIKPVTNLNEGTSEPELDLK